MITAYLSLGSNLGDRAANLRAAIDRLAPRRISRIYETEPVDYIQQDWFLNVVVEIDTALTADQLLDRTQAIERDLGRVRTIPKGPRTLDIDILLYGDHVIRTPRLEVPHPRMHERRFVLLPLAELAPDLLDPVLGKTIGELLTAAPAAVVRPWAQEPGGEPDK